MCACSRCEQLPEPLAESGLLYFVSPEPSTHAKLIKGLDSCELTAVAASDGIYRVETALTDLARWCDVVGATLNQVEQTDTRCLWMERGRDLEIRDIVRMLSFKSLLAHVRGSELREILTENRLTTFFQPIVDARDPGSVFGYECLLRGRSEAGEPVPPGRLFALAADGNMLFQLDRAARTTSIENARRTGITEHIFINFVPTSVYNPEFCLRTTVAAVDKAGLRNDRVIFEVVESEQISDLAHLIDILTYYRDNGFKVALDDMGSGYNSLNLIHQVKPDFLKLDMELVRGVDTDAFKASVSKSLLELAGELKIPTIAEGVETVEEYRWLRDHGATYLQGFLFAKPAAQPPIPQVPVCA